MSTRPTVVVLTTGGTIASRLDPATGAVRRGPATRGLTEVPVRVVSGVVQLT